MNCTYDEEFHQKVRKEKGFVYNYCTCPRVSIFISFIVNFLL